MSQKPFVLSVKALIDDGSSRYLLLKRSQASKNNAGCWDFPGGKIDPGETLDRALVREVAEETGLSISLENILGAAESELPDRKVVYLFVHARVDAGELRLSDEHDGFTWHSPQEIAASQICPQFRNFAQTLATRQPAAD